MNIRPITPSYKQIATVLMYIVSVSSLFLLLVAPGIATNIGIEDGPAENLTALLFLVASGAMILHGSRLLSSEKRNSQLAALLFLTAIAFFVFAGEEISWGQRLLGIESNEFLLEHNWQGELNIHNFHTDIANIGFHYGAFVFLIVLPLFRSRVLSWLSKIPRLDSFRYIIAPSWLALPSFAFMGMIDPRFLFVIEKPWAAGLYLIALLIGLLLLLDQIRSALVVKDRRTASLLGLSLLLIALGLFVSYQQAFDQSPNTISEYKELVIALGLTIFAIRLRIEK